MDFSFEFLFNFFSKFEELVKKQIFNEFKELDIYNLGGRRISIGDVVLEFF